MHYNPVIEPWMIHQVLKITLPIFPKHDPDKIRTDKIPRTPNDLLNPIK